MEIDKMKMQTRDGVADNIMWIAEKFPNCITEKIDAASGEVKLAVDFDMLRQELSSEIVEGKDERYQFVWPDKKKAVLLANAPINATLRPCEEESEDFANTQNLYIEGDNLDVLKCLKETYLGKVKMIYIDPPYNTGNDFVYNDDFSESSEDYLAKSAQYDEQGNRLVSNPESNGRFHTDWLNMMYPRLKVARELLSNDGIIFISIDDNELDNLHKICSEIFGEKNFVANMIWQSTAGSNTGTEIVTVTENVLVYTKQRNYFVFDGKLTDEESFNLTDEYVNERGKYSLDKMDRRRVAGHYSEALNFPIEMPDGTQRWPGGTKEKNNEGWNYLWSKTKVKWGIANGFIVFKQSNGEWNVYNKRYSKVDNEGNYIERTIPFRNLITSDQSNTAQGTSELRGLFEIRPFDFPKPSSFIKNLLLTSVRKNKECIILDFFSGSATTAHAVMQLNSEDGGKRKFIMVQVPENTVEDSEAFKAGYKTICDIGKERIRRAAIKIKTETGANIDYGFRVLKLDSTNMEDVFYSPAEVKQEQLTLFADNVKPGRTGKDLLFQSMLELGATLDSKIEKTVVNGKDVYNVADGYLVACFDTEVSDDVVKAIAKMQPQYAVLRDSSLKDDSTATNFEQIFKTFSPTTTCKIL